MADQVSAKHGKAEVSVFSSNAQQQIGFQHYWLWPAIRHVGTGIANSTGQTITIDAEGTYEIIADLNVTLNWMVQMVINGAVAQQRVGNSGYIENVHFHHIAEFAADTKVEFCTDNTNSTPYFNGTNNTVTVRRLA
eukprot:TRINITY_DN32331_c0_g1_i1.p2 TRINITY_DN32331_c0_g1~~TRINITY_DN32331_c0_g1_i1.p2  ORF type:complete len:136 (+),score=30.28 TRINITY_DN32331_c0_g1_i1:171-578(+)